MHIYISYVHLSLSTHIYIYIYIHICEAALGRGVRPPARRPPGRRPFLVDIGKGALTKYMNISVSDSHLIYSVVIYSNSGHDMYGARSQDDFYGDKQMQLYCLSKPMRMSSETPLLLGAGACEYFSGTCFFTSSCTCVPLESYLHLLLSHLSFKRASGQHSITSRAACQLQEVLGCIVTGTVLAISQIISGILWPPLPKSHFIQIVGHPQRSTSPAFAPCCQSLSKEKTRQNEAGRRRDPAAQIKMRMKLFVPGHLS